MKQNSVLLFLIINILYLLVSGDQNYVTKYDDIDLDEILGNERLLTNYVRCLMNEGPCTPDGQELKDTLPDAIETDCSKCTEKQRYGSEKVMHYLIDNKPDDWEKLEQMYDCEGTYRTGYLTQKAADEKKE